MEQSRVPFNPLVLLEGMPIDFKDKDEPMVTVVHTPLAGQRNQRLPLDQVFTNSMITIS